MKIGIITQPYIQTTVVCCTTTSTYKIRALSIYH